MKKAASIKEAAFSALFSVLLIFLVFRYGEFVAAVVVRVIRVALDPVEAHLVTVEQVEQTAPQLGILRRLLVALDPAARAPALRPALRDAVDDIFAVRIQIDRAGAP